MNIYFRPNSGKLFADKGADGFEYYFSAATDAAFREITELEGVLVVMQYCNKTFVVFSGGVQEITRKQLVNEIVDIIYRGNER